MREGKKGMGIMKAGEKREWSIVVNAAKRGNKMQTKM